MNNEALEMLFISAAGDGAIGFDVSDGEWLRVTYADGGRAGGLKKFSCLDVLSLGRCVRPQPPCRGEDRLLCGGDELCVVGRKGLSGLARLRTSMPDGKLLGGFGKSMTLSDFDKLKCAYELIYATDILIDVSATLSGVENTCSFVYNGTAYPRVPLGDPDYCGAENDGAGLVHAYLAAGVVPDPENAGRLVKTVLKIIPLPHGYSVNDAYGENSGEVINFYKEGYFYSAYDKDALLLNKLFGYKITAGKRAKTGVPVSGAHTVAARLAEKGVYAVFRDAYGREREIGQFKKSAAKPMLVPEGMSVDADGMITDADGVVYDAKRLEKEMKDKCVEVKEFIDAILCGVNPSTGRAIPPTDVARSPEVIERLKFAAEILVWASGRKGRKRKPVKSLFYFDGSVREKYPFSESPVTLSAIVNTVNELSDGERMQKLKFGEAASELVKRGILAEQFDESGKVISRIPTEEGKKRGVLYERRESQRTGADYAVVVYDINAQKYVLDIIAEAYPL